MVDRWTLVDGSLRLGKSSVSAASGWATNGIPLNGQMMVGMCTPGTSGGTNSVSDFQGVETKIGQSLAMHRMYYNEGTSRPSSESPADCAAAHTAGHIPWVSFKGRTWSTGAAGGYDSWAENLAAQLGALSGPVWVCIEHEPDVTPSGTAADYITMQRRLLPYFNAYPNIATTMVVGSYPATHGGGSYSDYWPGSAYCDIYGLDPYNEYEYGGGAGWAEFYDAVADGDQYDRHLTVFDQWRASIGEPDLPFALGEFGYKGDAAETPQNYFDPDLSRNVSTNGPGWEWIQRQTSDVRAHGGLAVCYFDYAAGGDKQLDSANKIADMGAAAATSDFYPF